MDRKPTYMEQRIREAGRDPFAARNIGWTLFTVVFFPVIALVLLPFALLAAPIYEFFHWEGKMERRHAAMPYWGGTGVEGHRGRTEMPELPNGL